MGHRQDSGNPNDNETLQNNQGYENAQKLPSVTVTGWTSHSLSQGWLKHV